MIGSMQSGYFTSLLVNDVEASQIAAHQNDPINNEAPAGSKGAQGRTKNFSNQEDLLLVSAWLNVSMEYMTISIQTKSSSQHIL